MKSPADLSPDPRGFPLAGVTLSIRRQSLRGPRDRRIGHADQPESHPYPCRTDPAQAPGLVQASGTASDLVPCAPRRTMVHGPPTASCERASVPGITSGNACAMWASPGTATISGSPDAARAWGGSRMGVVPTDMVVGGAYPDDRTFARVGRGFSHGEHAPTACRRPRASGARAPQRQIDSRPVPSAKHLQDARLRPTDTFRRGRYSTPTEVSPCCGSMTS